MQPDPSVTPDLDAVMRRCDRSIRGHGTRPAADRLAELLDAMPELATSHGGSPPDDSEATDTYGEGGVVAQLEQALCDLLDVEAAVFMPTGTMAQQIALRIHADRRGVPVVALHATSHILLHEDDAVARLHHLHTAPLGEAVRPWTAADVEALTETVAAVGIELPLRELGGLLPPWEEVVAVVEAAHDRGAAVHLDGARLWEAAAGYGRSPAEVAGCVDSTYVSFYKGLGAIAGAALVGDPDLVAAARLWRHRHGGTAYGLWPYAASALHALRTRLPRMGSYLDTTRHIAAGLNDQVGIEVVPAEPHTAMLHLHVEVDAEAFTAAARAVAEEDGVATWTQARPTARPGWYLLELAVGDATVSMGADAVVDAVRGLMARARPA